MKQYGHGTLLGVMLVLLGGCAGVPTQDALMSTGMRQAHVSNAVQGAHDGEGATVAAHLQERYDDAVVDCRKYADDPNPLPAVLCSGILLRTVNRGAGYDIWNPNMSNAQPRGVSFSWLRKDNALGALARGYYTGFIILPHFYADSPGDGYTQLTVLCAFPVDGATDTRNSAEKDGCGPSTVAGTGACQALGITTSAQWMARFGNGALYQEQCVFMMKPGTAGAYQAFAQLALIRNALGSKAFDIQNEIKIGTWAQNDSHIPLEAFFFIAGNTAALNEAKANQQDFNTRFSRWAPVIRVTLPTAMNGPASFAYTASEQAIP